MLVSIDHSRFTSVQREIFIHRVVADCMVHECRLRKEDDRLKLDACCQYGVDVDISERDNILVHEEQIRGLLREEVTNLPLFKTDVEEDPDFPSGKFVRTTTHNDGCIFLAHDLRGCAIHRASIEGGWDFDGTKPHVCRLFPLSYDDESIVLSDDYDDYSCAVDPDAPTVYRVGRHGLGEIFGAELIAELDRVEARITQVATSLRVIASP